MPIGRALLASSGRELWPRPASVRAITRPNAPTASAEPNLQLTHSSSRHPALQRSCLACPCVCDSHPAATAPARPKPAVPRWPLPVRAWCAHTSARLAYLGLIARRVTARAPSMLSLRHQPRCVSRKKARRLQPTSAQSRTLSPWPCPRCHSEFTSAFVHGATVQVGPLLATPHQRSFRHPFRAG